MLPLTVDRHLEAVADESSSWLVVVRETIRQQAGELLDVDPDQPVRDGSLHGGERPDDQAFHVQSGQRGRPVWTYHLNLPFDTRTDQTYDVYVNEVDDSYEIAADSETPTGAIEGLDVSYFAVSVDEAPMSDAYVADYEQGGAVAHVADARPDEAPAAGGWHRRRGRGGGADGAHP